MGINKNDISLMAGAQPGIWIVFVRKKSDKDEPDSAISSLNLGDIKQKEDMEIISKSNIVDVWRLI